MNAVVVNNLSMNGIITYDDGQGGVLENGTLTSNNVVTDNTSINNQLVINGTVPANQFGSGSLVVQNYGASISGNVWIGNETHLLGNLYTPNLYADPNNTQAYLLGVADPTTGQVLYYNYPSNPFSNGQYTGQIPVWNSAFNSWLLTGDSHLLQIGYNEFTTSPNTPNGNGNVSIGWNCSYNQNSYSLCLGANAGPNSSPDYCIIINADAQPLDGQQAGSLYINPIRQAQNSNFLLYDSTNKEVTYSNNITFNEIAIQNDLSVPTIAVNKIANNKLVSDNVLANNLNCNNVIINETLEFKGQILGYLYVNNMSIPLNTSISDITNMYGGLNLSGVSSINYLIYPNVNIYFYDVNGFYLKISSNTTNTFLYDTISNFNICHSIKIYFNNKLV